MQAARYHGVRDVRIEDVEVRSPGPDDVRIEVAAGGICGSDLHEYAHGRGATPSEPHPVTGESTPLTLGHEFGGTVAEVGADVERFAPGDPVAVNPIIWCDDCGPCDAGQYHRCVNGGFVGLSGGGGGFAEQVTVPAETVLPFPESVPLELAALVEPYAVGLHAVRRSAFETGDAVAVFGTGPIGLTIVQHLDAAGAGPIYVSEPRDARRERAIDSGATVPIDPTAEAPVDRIVGETNGGVDVAFEVAGIEATLAQSVEATRPGGDVTVVSLFQEAVSFQPTGVVANERTLTGTAAYQGGPRSAEEFGPTIRKFETGALDPELLVTSRIDLPDIDQGFEALLDDGSDEVKILVSP